MRATLTITIDDVFEDPEFITEVANLASVSPPDPNNKVSVEDFLQDLWYRDSSRFVKEFSPDLDHIEVTE